MTNVNVDIKQILPQAGASNSGERLGWIDSAAKAAQNDTLTILNGDLVQVLSVIDDTTGAWEDHTVSGNVITLTTVTTGAKTLQVLYK